MERSQGGRQFLSFLSPCKSQTQPLCSDRNTPASGRSPALHHTCFLCHAESQEQWRLAAGSQRGPGTRLHEVLRVTTYREGNALAITSRLAGEMALCPFGTANPDCGGIPTDNSTTLQPTTATSLLSGGREEDGVIHSPEWPALIL